jgi:SNF2 family DNA or RNA helicase
MSVSLKAVEVKMFLFMFFFSELEQMRASDPAQKAIVFSSFTQFLSIIEIHLTKAGFVTCRFVGSMSQQQRSNVMHEFQQDGGPNVMVISLKAGNAGINLIRANHVYLMDPWWNTSVEQQAADR